ncbi:MAG: branched-chain amino acid ABC transporter substrate-binding protein [Anaerolineae bacterium]|nr:branched-chain amino acid ABC transporter substrate-binding protein [Anaerolineae bacterium]
MKASRFSVVVLLLVLAVVLSTSLVQAQDTQVIKIASQSPLSGGQSLQGVGIRNGVELAIAQLSGPLTELGFEIQYVPFDDQATPDVGVANAQQIVADPAILAVIGHYNSGVAIPSSEVYNSNNLVMVSPANTGVNVTDRGLPTVNRVCGRDDAQGAVGAQFASEQGITSVYVIHDTTAYGQGVAEFFRDGSTELGITVLGFEGTEERSNFESIIQPILALAPDAVYMGGIYDQMGVLANQLVAGGFTGQLLGPDGLDSGVYVESGGAGVVGTYYSSAAGPASVFPDAAQFIADYTEAYGAAPIPYSAESFDATAIVLEALVRAIEANDGALPTREAVTAEVRATTDFEGLTGTITFDDTGDRELANYFVLEVVSEDPAAWGDNTVVSQIQIPSPLTAAAMEMATPEATEASS